MEVSCTFDSSADDRIIQNRVKAQVYDLLFILDDDEMDIIYRHYFLHETHKQIAVIYACSRSRISQIHNEALQKMKAHRRAKEIRQLYIEIL